MNSIKKSCVNCKGLVPFTFTNGKPEDFRCMKNDNKQVHNLNPCLKYQFETEEQKKIKLSENKDHPTV